MLMRVNIVIDVVLAVTIVMAVFQVGHSEKLIVSIVCNRYSMRPVFYEIYRHEHEGEAPRASCHVYCIKHEDFSCYMCFISQRPLTYRVIINQKELYDFYYTAITLTTGYKTVYCMTNSQEFMNSCCLYSIVRESISPPLLQCTRWDHTIGSVQYSTHFEVKWCSISLYNFVTLLLQHCILTVAVMFFPCRSLPA